jgi:heme-degrading monooxygenase HmoA
MPVMRFSHGKLKPGGWKDYEKLYRELSKERTNVPGLLGSILAQDADDEDAGFTVSIWETVEDMKAYERSERAQAVGARFKPLHSGDYTTTISDMRLWDVRGAGASPDWAGRERGPKS